MDAPRNLSLNGLHSIVVFFVLWFIDNEMSTFDVQNTNCIGFCYYYVPNHVVFSTKESLLTNKSERVE